MQKKILIIVTVAIALLAAGIFIFKAVSGDSETATTTANTTTTLSQTTSSTAASTTESATESTTASTTAAKTVAATTNENGDILINAADLDTGNATFIKYEYSGAAVELIAIKDTDETVRVSFNTCSVCNGAPQAYFTQQNGKLVCQNCKNQFTLDSIGVVANGCYPICLDSTFVTETDTGITIQSSYLQANTALFENVAEHE